MAVKCVNHSGVAARGKCSVCGDALCDECRLSYKNKPVCEKCLEAIRHKLATDASAVFESAPVTDAPIPDIDAQTATRSVEAVIAARERLEEASRPTRGRLLVLGSMLSAILGTALSLLVAYGMSHNLPVSFGYMLVGYAVGFAMVVGSGGRGRTQAILSTVIAFLAFAVSIYHMLDEAYTSKMIQDGAPVVMLPFSQFLLMIQGLGYFEWFFVAVGLVVAFWSSKKPVHDF